MKIRFILIALLNICLIAAEDGSGFQDESKKAICVQNVSIIDVESGKVLEQQTIQIRDGKITFVGGSSSAPDAGEEVQVVNGRGKFAIPGLWDMHIHAYSPKDMQLFPINGVVGVRLMWGMPMHHAWRKDFESGTQLGPRMMIASAIIDGPKPIWPGSIVAIDKESGVAAVDKAIKGNADFAKVYSLLPRDAYFAIADTCKRKGLPFDGHVPRMVTVTEASNAGQRSMEHMYEVQIACSSRATELRKILADFVEQNEGEVRSLFTGDAPGVMRQAFDSYDAEIAAELFSKLKKNSTWQCPTLTVLRNLAFLTEPEIQSNPNLKYINKGMRNFIAPKQPRRKQSDEQVLFERKRFEKTLQMVGSMHQAGVPIIAGTDVLNPFCLPGFSLHTELQLMVKAGLSSAEALKTATINAAKFQNKTDTMGSIAVGKMGDVVLLNENPLSDIANSRKIDTVIFRGQVLDRAKLDSKLKEFEN